MRSIIAAAIVWPPILVIFFFLAIKAGPDIESFLSPVLVDQAVSDIRRDNDEVCWTWKWTKTHDAIPAGFAWSFILHGTSVDYPAVVQRRTDRRIVSETRVRTTGPGSVDLCARIPAVLADVPGLVIDGSVAYLPPHRWWNVWQDIPPVAVPGPQGLGSTPQEFRGDPDGTPTAPRS